MASIRRLFAVLLFVVAVVLILLSASRLMNGTQESEPRDPEMRNEPRLTTPIGEAARVLFGGTGAAYVILPFVVGLLSAGVALFLSLPKRMPRPPAAREHPDDADPPIG